MEKGQEAKRLSDGEIQGRLRLLEGWDIREGRLFREYRFRTFLDAIAFINTVAKIADGLDHHPTIHNSYNSVTLELTTHKAGGITQKDFELAEQIGLKSDH